MNVRRRLHGDDGTSLLLALAFISLLGIFTVAILSATYSDFKTTTVVRARTDALYSADGAADFALAQMQGNNTCASGSLSPQPPTINGASSTVNYTCTDATQTVASTNPFLGSYSVSAKGQYGIYVAGSIQAGNNLTMNIYGDAFSENRDNLDAGSTSDDNKLVFNGNLAVGESPCDWDTTTDPKVIGTCTANASPPAITTPTVIVPSAAAPAMKTGSGGNANCRILYPGKYGSGGLAWPTMDATKGYYLASGTYYLNDVQPQFAGYIRGGAVGTTTATMGTAFNSRCPTSYATDANVKTLTSSYAYTGSGVTFVLGGNSRITFENSANTQVELFPRVPGTASTNPDKNATAGVSIWARYVTGGATGTYNVSNLYDHIWTENDKLTDVVVHGFTYMPDAKLYVAPLNNTDAGGAAQLRGGAFLEKLDLVSDNHTGVAPIAGIPASVVPGPKTRTFTIVTQQPGGGGTTTLTVVAEYPTSGAAPTVKSWRKA